MAPVKHSAGKPRATIEAEAGEFPYQFVPKPDITAYELAIIYSEDSAICIKQWLYDALPPEAQRHCVKIRE